MNIVRILQAVMILLAAFGLAILLPVRAPVMLPSAPPSTVQGQSFSMAAGNPLADSGVHPADILGLNGFPLIACADLGLICSDPTTGALDDIVALSFGWDFNGVDLPAFQFSVDTASQGLADTAVRLESDCSPSEVQADLFETSMDGRNEQDLDGDGVACSTNQGFGLGLTEGTPSDNVDAVERDPCQFVDFDCDGVLEAPLFLTLAADSPSLALLGATTADILIAGIEYVPMIWANGVTDLGLATGDAIDAICIRENRSGVYDNDDQVLISLAPGSPTLAALSASASDLLRVSPPRVFFRAESLGLQSADNADALVCTAEISFQDIFLPDIQTTK